MGGINDRNDLQLITAETSAFLRLGAASQRSRSAKAPFTAVLLSAERLSAP
ncbi:hypothetical protein B0H17DRAFT_1209988 [Mycena rosella]|uniref:Uncharacterized protein n=1 Tax=Mycena rosella TaxID=1033263 RepID=A0AAD7CYG7_MYCRO|nr:hypothetical protein B0H17DRAFT_1209988 [Mycena rosella]